MEEAKTRSTSSQSAFLFDLDGTLIDNVYQHVIAWQRAPGGGGIQLAVWRIHRRVGMSGGLLVNALLRETGRRVTAKEAAHLQQSHAEAYSRQVAQIRPLPGARELSGTFHATAYRGPLLQVEGWRPPPALQLLEIPSNVPVITRDEVDHAKPDPDLFLAAAERIHADIGNSVVVGDSVWDLLAARRARALGVGLMSGGHGRDELERAGAYRVYHDAADLLTTWTKSECVDR